MNTAADIFAYAKTHDISLVAEDGQLKIDAPEKALTDDFLESAKQHKADLLEVLTKEDRWDPELSAKGYVWCIDCQYFNGVNCNHTDNPFNTVTKCPQAPRKCQWYEVKE